jgi:pimeloyl-[acyl-carrier protein] synthase
MRQLVQTQPNENFDVDISLVGKLGNQFLTELSTLREIEPIHWSAASHGWMITRHADVDDSLQGRFPLSLRRVENIIFNPLPPEDQAQLPLLRRFIPHWPIEMDPPEHTRLRKLLVKAFSKKVVEAIRPFVKARVATLMQKLEQQPETEFNEAIARQLPGSVILKLFGLPQQHLSRLKDWANAFQEGIGVPYADMAAKRLAEKALKEMTDLFMVEIERRRREPARDDDLISSLLAASEDGDALTEDEMLGSLQLALVAGHDTTSATLTLGLAALAEHPDLWEYMYRHEDKMLDSCLELMRFVAMSTAQVRVAGADFEWHGKHLKKGDFVWLMFAAANRDPRVFPDPERIDPTRNNERSMVFAPGLHHCIGHLLAKMQVTEFFGELVRRFEGAKLLDPRLDFMSQISFRGLYHLNVKMRPRKAS